MLFAPEEMGGVSLEEVIEAYYDCRRNKRNTANQLRFEMDYERECILLWQEINEHRYEPRRSIAFVVEKPVKREIFAADFRDRVVHHLIVRRMMPLLEAKYHPESYSTQKGKGTLYGIQRIEQQLKECSQGYTRDCYIMKLDISGFFMSLSKQALYDCIRRFLQPRYPARDLPMLLYLLRQTIFNRPEKSCVLKMPRSRWKGLPRNKSLFGSDGMHGIPIGNLTSQLLALLYLDDLDTLITGEWGVPHYGRYVDDMVLIHPSKQHLLAVKEKISQWLEAHGLRLHPKKTYVQHYAKGVLFIGGMILPGRKYISRRTVGFMYEALETCRRLVGDSTDPPQEVKERVRATVNSYFGMLQHYDAHRLTSHIIRQLPQEWFQWMYIVRHGHRCKMVVKQTIELLEIVRK